MSFESLLPAFSSRKSEPDVFRELRSEVGRVFDQFNSLTPLSGSLDLLNAEGFSVKPNLDVTETDSGIEVTVDVPGVKEDDLDVQLDGVLLTIKGSRITENTEEDKNYKIVERSSGSFQRTIRLPFEPESGKVAARLETGVLTLSIDKPAEVTDKVIKINIGDEKKSSGKTGNAKKVEKTRGDATPA